MDQEARYYQYLELLTREMASPGQISVEAVYEDLRELCRMLRVCKGVTTFYSSLAEERKGGGDTYTPYDDGSETDRALTVRSDLSDFLVGQCTVYHAKGEAPWTDEELSRIDTIQRMMLNFISRDRMRMMIRKATLYDDAGYGNIRLFTQRVEKIGNEQGLKDYCAARIDLKHFSLINQQLGREDSSVIMKTYIRRLEETIGEEGTVCRLGGDHFVLLFRKEKLDQVVRLLEGTPIHYGEEPDGRIMISARAGILVIPEDYYYHEFSDLMDRIINAYNAAKAGWRGDIIFSTEKMLKQRDRAMRIRQSFPVALQNHEILVFYQPKISVGTKSIVGAEALSRWYNKGKLMLPADFIPVLEQSMDICKLDFHVLEQVCRDLRRWLDEGKPTVRISVNFSRRHLMDMDVLDHILAVVDRWRVPHHLLEIELTETTTDVEFKSLKRVVTGLQDAGIYTSVDDFGVGYSSLNMIRDIPWNTLKVDKNILPLNEKTGQDRLNIMFRHVVNMAREIGITCVAEGVETSEQVDILRRNGCDIAQGFYYDKPLPIRDFEKRMAQQAYPDRK